MGKGIFIGIVLTLVALCCCAVLGFMAIMFNSPEFQTEFWKSYNESRGKTGSVITAPPAQFSPSVKLVTPATEIARPRI